MTHDGQEPPPSGRRYRLSEYDRKRMDELNSANAPAFWLAFPVVVIGGTWLLIQLLDWWHGL